MNNSSKGPSLITILAVIFIVLKLTHLIRWSWWWVLSPIWLSAFFVLLIIFLAVILGGKRK